MASSPGIGEWTTRSSPLQQVHRSSPSHASAHSPIIKSSPVPGTTSTAYPERMIRPLPRRRLRDRLSAEQSKALELPTVPQRNAPLFSFPFPFPEDSRNFDKGDESIRSEGSGKREERRLKSPPPPPSPPPTKSSGQRSRSQRTLEGRTPPQNALDSGSSSVEGDESFETNNKKKRKIPQSNGLGLGHHSSLSTDMANIRISPRDSVEREQAEDGEGVVGSYYGTGTAVPPISTSTPSLIQGNGAGTTGAGRGRFGRNGRGSLERRPLATSTNGLNYGATSPSGGQGRMRAPVGTGKPSQQMNNVPGNIIGSAIARSQETSQANSATSPNSAQNENTSVIEQSKPPAGPFTFTRQPPTETHWPGAQGPYSMDAQYSMPGQYPDARRPGATPTTPGSASTAQLQQQASTSSHQSANQQSQPPKKNKGRRPDRIYEIAARQRRLNQEYANFHHPPRREDVWICEFCEYESIYGMPPRALIKSYEIKDRQEQKRQAERRRLLEKAKNKGRKNKKGNKAPAANNQPPPAPSASAAQAMQNAKNSFAHQAAEFQKREMLRAHAQMDRAAKERERMMAEAQARGEGQLDNEALQEDEYDDEEYEEEYYDEGDTEDYYGEEERHPPPPPGVSIKGKERQIEVPLPPPPTLDATTTAGV